MNNLRAISSLSLLLWSTLGMASDNILNTEINRALHIEEQIQFSQNKIEQIRESVWAFYAANSGWPSNLNAITTGADPFYTGTLTTPFGAINGSPSTSGDSFIFTVSAGASANESRITQIKRLAAQLGGQYTSTSHTAVITSEPPHGASLVKNMLSRVEDVSGQNLNAMEIDLEMSGFNIDDVGDIFGVTAEIGAYTKATDAIAVNVTSVDFETVNSDIVRLSADSINVTTGEANTFEVLNQLTTVTGVAATATSQDMIADTLDTETLNSNEVEVIDRLTGDTMDFRVGAVTNQLNTPELIVNGEAHAASVSFNTVESRHASTISINDATQFQSPVTTQDVVSNNNITQSSNQIATFNGSIETNSLIVNEGATTESFVNTGLLTVRENATIGGNFSIAGQTTLDGALYAETMQLSGSFNSQDLNASQDVRADSGLFIGGKRLSDNDGQNLYENGVRLETLYLKKGEKADNTDRLDGKALSYFAQLDTSNTFSQNQTFNNVALSGGSLRVGGHLIASSSGKLYERGTALSSIYETKSNLTSQKNAAKSELDQVKAQYLALVSAVGTGLSGDISALESKHASNVSGTNTLYSNSSSLVTITNTTKSNASSAKSSVDSLVNSANSEYNRKRTYQKVKVSNSNTNSSETRYEDRAIGWVWLGNKCGHGGGQYLPATCEIGDRYLLYIKNGGNCGILAGDYRCEYL